MLRLKSGNKTAESQMMDSAAIQEVSIVMALQPSGDLVSRGNGILDVADFCAVDMVAVGEDQRICILDNSFYALSFEGDGVFRHRSHLGAGFDPDTLFHHAHSQLAPDNTALSHHDLRCHFQNGDLPVPGEAVIQRGGQEVRQLTAYTAAEAGT